VPKNKRVRLSLNIHLCKGNNGCYSNRTKRGNGNGDGVKTRPQRRLTQAELDSFLEKAADLLRGGVDHSEFRGYLFALLFYKRISDVYVENVIALEKELGDPELAKDPRMHDFVVPDECVWEAVSGVTELRLGTALNDAMRAIERANEPKFNGILANSTVDFNAQDRLPRSNLLPSSTISETSSP